MLILAWIYVLFLAIVRPFTQVVTFTLPEGCNCCPVDLTCPPRLSELSADDATLNVEITCDGDCTGCLQDGPFGGPECWPDTGTMPSSGAFTNLWSFSGLTCNPNSPQWGCYEGVLGWTFASSSCVPVTIPTVLVSVQNSPFMVVYTMSSHWWGYCSWDSELGNCTGERTVTVTITEP